jgi:hypothetical protein
LAAAAVLARAVRPRLAAVVVALLASQQTPLHLVPPERLDRGSRVAASRAAPAQKAALAAVAQSAPASPEPVPPVGVVETPCQ